MVAALVGAVLCACGRGADGAASPRPGYARHPAAIRDGSDQGRIALPGRAVVGESVDVVVTTLGGGCTAGGDTEVRQRGLIVDLSPYDQDLIPSGDPNEACPALLAHLPHRVRLVFGDTGLATIRVHGAYGIGLAAPDLRLDAVLTGVLPVGPASGRPPR